MAIFYSLNPYLYENKIKMRTNKIRLTESQLHKVIKESVKRVLKESVESDIWHASDEYSQLHDFPYCYYDYYGPRPPKNSSKEDENEYSWEALNALDDLKKSNMKKRQERAEKTKEFFDKFGPSRKDFMDGVYDKVLDKMFYERLKKDLDNKWKDTKDMEKVSKRADSRPLHRKGSLNRAMD